MKGNVFVLTVTRSAWFLFVEAAMTYFSLYVLALGGTMEAIGFVNGLRPLALLFMYPLAGYIADYKGRVKLIGFAGCLSALTYLFYIFARDWITIAIGTFLQGLVVLHLPPISALLADSLPLDNRGVAYATITAIDWVVRIPSPYIAGYFITKYGVDITMRSLFALILICGVIIAALRLKFLKETVRVSDLGISLRKMPSLWKASYKSVWETLEWMPKNVKFFAIIITLFAFFNAIVAPFWIVYGIKVIKLTTLEWGFMVLLNGVLRTALLVPAGVIVDKYGKRRTIMASLALTIFPVALFVYCKSFIETLTLSLIISVANAFLTPACSALTTDMVPRKKRGRIMATLGQGTIAISGPGYGHARGGGFLSSILIMLGSLAGGYIYAFNPYFSWIILTASILICLILCFKFLKEPKKPEL
jgi:MFS family permease